MTSPYVAPRLDALRQLPPRQRFAATQEAIRAVNDGTVLGELKVVRGEAIRDMLDSYKRASDLAEELGISRQLLHSYQREAARAAEAGTAARADSESEEEWREREARERVEMGKTLSGHPDTWPSQVQAGAELVRTCLAEIDAASESGDWETAQLDLRVIIGQAQSLLDLLQGRIPEELVAEGRHLMETPPPEDPREDYMSPQQIAADDQILDENEERES